jgi:hypothetical protein
MKNRTNGRNARTKLVRKPVVYSTSNIQKVLNIYRRELNKLALTFILVSLIVLEVKMYMEIPLNINSK